MQVKKQQLEPNMEKWTGSKLGTEYGKENCHSAYVQYTSYRMPGWVGHKLEPRFLEETSTTKQGDNLQPCHPPSPVLKLSVFPCLVLTAAS